MTSPRYKGRPFKKKYIADFFVYGKIIVELKAPKCVTDQDKAQTINDLKATEEAKIKSRSHASPVPESPENIRGVCLFP